MTPSILISYIFLDDFLANRGIGEEGGKEWYNSWALDSGAFSALTRKIEIDLHAYTDRALSLIDQEKSLTIIFALDVIGDTEASIKNAEYMNEQGVPATPTFHYGSSWHYLEYLAKKYDKIALGGLVARGSAGFGSKLGWKDRLGFLENCFSRVWPKWIHGFGCTDPRLLFRLPFAAVDSTSWYFRVRQYGRIQGYPSLPSPMVSKSRTGAEAGTRCSLLKFLEMEQDVRARMGKYLKQHGYEPFTLRLASMASTEELSFLKGLT